LGNTLRIPLRVAVIGTRGKSTVTRMIAAALKEAGFSVLAKTTGSKPVLILPDGREEEIARRGLPTILEQKRLLQKAANLGVRAVVTEMMSIQPECLAIESRLFLQPQYLVVTNVRLDHREEMGQSKGEIARSLSAAIQSGTSVFVPASECHPEFELAAGRVGAKITLVNTEADSFIEEDRRLAAAVASCLGVSASAALRGISAAAEDFGSLKAWEAELGVPPTTWILASAFAANEPESSRLVLSYLQKKLTPNGRPLVGILNFRADRGDRTRQWLEAHGQGFFSGFRSVYAVGAHVHSLSIRRRTGRPPSIIPLSDRSPTAIMGKIAASEGASSLLIGFGNIGGTGEALVEHWQKIGRSHAL